MTTMKKTKPNNKKWLIVLAVLVALIAAGGSYYYLVWSPQQIRLAEAAKKKAQAEKIAVEKASRKLHENFVLDDGRNIKPDYVNIMDRIANQREVSVFIMGPNNNDEFKGMKLVNSQGVTVGESYEHTENDDTYTFRIQGEESKDYTLVFADGNTVKLQPYTYYPYKAPESASRLQPTYQAPSSVHCSSYDYGGSTSTNCFSY
jgi:hypothetical protein